MRSVQMRAGPMRGVEPTAMELAWRSVVKGTAWQSAELVLELLPWRLKCAACGNEFAADDLFVKCECGNERPTPLGGDELQVVSITVDE